MRETKIEQKKKLTSLIDIRRKYQVVKEGDITRHPGVSANCFMARFAVFSERQKSLSFKTICVIRQYVQYSKVLVKLGDQLIEVRHSLKPNELKQTWFRVYFQVCKLHVYWQLTIEKL